MCEAAPIVVPGTERPAVDAFSVPVGVGDRRDRRRLRPALAFPYVERSIRRCVRRATGTTFGGYRRRRGRRWWEPRPDAVVPPGVVDPEVVVGCAAPRAPGGPGEDLGHCGIPTLAAPRRGGPVGDLDPIGAALEYLSPGGTLYRRYPHRTTVSSNHTRTCPESGIKVSHTPARLRRRLLRTAAARHANIVRDKRTVLGDGLAWRPTAASPVESPVLGRRPDRE